MKRPMVHVVRDPRRVRCSGGGDVTACAVKVAQTHGFFAFCRDCSRRIGVASERLVTTDRHDLEG